MEKENTKVVDEQLPKIEEKKSRKKKKKQSQIKIC